MEKYLRRKQREEERALLKSKPKSPSTDSKYKIPKKESAIPKREQNPGSSQHPDKSTSKNTSIQYNLRTKSPADKKETLTLKSGVKRNRGEHVTHEQSETATTKKKPATVFETLKKPKPSNQAVKALKTSNKIEPKKPENDKPANEFFTKYKIPKTYVANADNILKEQKELEAQKMLLKKASEIELPSEGKCFKVARASSTVAQGAKLNCQHLSDDQLLDAFKDNLQYVTEIFNGTRPSKRHELFAEETNVKQFYKEDLTYNTSMSVFTYKQLEVLLERLHKAFDKGHFDEHTQYYFQVLLPELCLKIFMDNFFMDYQSATEYLDKH